jgi:hypothetical protein
MHARILNKALAKFSLRLTMHRATKPFGGADVQTNVFFTCALVGAASFTPRLF